jgi:hypothetical protein
MSDSADQYPLSLDQRNEEHLSAIEKSLDDIEYRLREIEEHDGTAESLTTIETSTTLIMAGIFVLIVLVVVNIVHHW